MPTSKDSVCFLEQTDFSLLLARGAAGSQPLRLEALAEVPLADAAALGAAVRAVFATESASVVCALRPKPRLLHFANASEAKLHPGLGGARQFATKQPGLASLPPAWLAAVQARDGAAPGTAPWLLSLTSAEGHAATDALLDSLKLKTARSVSATLNSVGAIAASVTAPIWLLEIGELASSALLVSRDGVHAAGPVSLNLDRLAEAVQAELGLKFRGSAVKLFFNPVYDYSEVGAKIAGRLAPALKTELAALRGANDAPIALACAGLPAAQQWFATQLAAALELAAFAPELKTADVTFASPELEATVSPAWFGFLRFVGANRAAPAVAWEAEWLKLDTIAMPVAAKAPAAVPVAAAAFAPAPAFVAPKPVVTSYTPVTAAAPRLVAAGGVSSHPFEPAAGTPKIFAPAASKAAAVAPVVVAAPRSVATAPSPTISFSPEPVVTTKSSAAVANKAAPIAPAAKPAGAGAAVSYAPKPAGGGSPPAAPAPKKSTRPPPVVLPREDLPIAEEPPVAGPSSSFFKTVPGMITALLVLLLAVGGFFYIQSSRQEAARLAEEKARTEQRLQAEIARARVIEQQAKAEVDARKKAEVENARKLAEAEAGRQRAENDARTQSAARLANARGTLTIATDPAGATVTVGTLPPRPSPASYSDLKIGRYPVTIALDQYDTAQLEFEVKEDAVTDAGTIKLVKIVGALELVTEPASVAYEVKPANALIVLPDARHTGRTPDTLTGLAPGDYTVTFVRDGWVPRVETVTIQRDVTAHVKGTFPNGIVKITSKPAGAVVTRDGVRLGVTPLTLSDQLPGDANYTVGLPGYATDQLSGRIMGGEVLELFSPLELFDHLSRLSELDQQPKVLSTVQPKVPYEFRQASKSGQVNIELTVTRDGSTKDLVIMPGSDRTLAPACLAAAAQWKFKPGSIHGKPANVRVIVPFSFEPTQ